eukprot:4615073-Prymnesium_polylepis.1
MGYQWALSVLSTCYRCGMHMVYLSYTRGHSAVLFVTFIMSERALTYSLKSVCALCPSRPKSPSPNSALRCRSASLSQAV